MKINKNGFTLMELLIVVIIIAGFAAVTYPSYTSSIERARVSEAVTMLGTIQAAQEKHFVNYEEYGTVFRDINDFEPAIENFNPNLSSFDTEYFTYTLNNDNTATATRIGANKGYSLTAFYTEDFIRCNVTNDSKEVDKVCSSLTDQNKVKAGSYYPIY